MYKSTNCLFDYCCSESIYKKRIVSSKINDWRFQNKVPYFLCFIVFIKTTKTRCTALSVWNVVKDRLCFRGSLCCFPKASAKVQLFFLPPNFSQLFFRKNALFLFYLHSTVSFFKCFAQFSQINNKLNSILLYIFFYLPLLKNRKKA